MLFNANHFTVISGCGAGHTALNAFDNALQNSGVGNYNLVRVSSILPPKCKESPIISVLPGSLLPIAYSAIESSIEDEEIAAAIGVGIPIDSNNVGVIMEYSTREKNIDVEQVVTKMIQCAMDHRKIQIANIIVKSCRLKNTGEHGCAFAAIALW